MCYLNSLIKSSKSSFFHEQVHYYSFSSSLCLPPSFFHNVVSIYVALFLERKFSSAKLFLWDEIGNMDFYTLFGRGKRKRGRGSGQVRKGTKENRWLVEDNRMETREK